MSKHTTGPWVFDPENTGQTYDVGYGIYSYPDPQGWAGPTVAQIPLRSCGRVPVSEEEAKANARLIAAAPDLLAALKALIETDRHDLTDKRPCDSCSAARAAIAKAEGK